MKNLLSGIFLAAAATSGLIFSGCYGAGSQLQGTWELAASADGKNAGAILEVEHDSMDFQSLVRRKNPDGTYTNELKIHFMGFFGVDNQQEPADGLWDAQMSIEEISIEPLDARMVEAFNRFSFCGRTDWAVGVVQRLGGEGCGRVIGLAGFDQVTQYTVIKIENGQLRIGHSTPGFEGLSYETRHEELGPQVWVKKD